MPPAPSSLAEPVAGAEPALATFEVRVTGNPVGKRFELLLAGKAVALRTRVLGVFLRLHWATLVKEGGWLRYDALDKKEAEARKLVHYCARSWIQCWAHRLWRRSTARAGTGSHGGLWCGTWRSMRLPRSERPRSRAWCATSARQRSARQTPARRWTRDGEGHDT